MLTVIVYPTSSPIVNALDLGGLGSGDNGLSG